MRILTSWDDGTREDITLANLLLKYKIPATFYIPTRQRELDDAQVRELAENFEIGSHTVYHNILTRMKDEAKMWCEIKDSKEYWEDFLQKPCDSFCYPRGYYNPTILNLVKEAGYKTARTTLVLYTEVDDPLQMHTTIHARKDRQEYDQLNWVGLAKDYLNRAIEKDGYFHLWGHSREVDKFNQWDNLEEVLKMIHEALSTKSK